MLLVIGILGGILVSFIGSMLLSFIPFIPLGPIFLTTVIPSIIVFVFITYRTKPDAATFTYWLQSFFSLFAICIIAFFAKNYFEAQATARNPGSSLNWDAVILFNILYSLGAALLFSPIGYSAIRWIADFKKQRTLV